MKYPSGGQVLEIVGSQVVARQCLVAAIHNRPETETSVIIVEDLYTPTSPEKDVRQVHQVNLALSWMDLILKFLESDILLEEKIEADKIRRKAPRFWLSEDKKLYKQSFSGPYLLCVHPEMLESLLEELHEGICESHIGGRSLSHRAITQGYR